MLRGARRDQWLFLNAHPASFVEPGALSVAELATALAAHGVRPDEVVVELLEASSVNTAAIAHRVSELKALGCLIALDDFGAGHSNFERVFELSPHIVSSIRACWRAAAATIGPGVSRHRWSRCSMNAVRWC